MSAITIDFLPRYAPLIEEALHAEGLYTGLLMETLKTEEGFRSLWNHLDTNGIDGESKVASDCVRAIRKAVSLRCSHVTAFHGCRVYSAETYRENPEVSALYGNVDGSEFGLFVTLGSFTNQARNFARNKSNLRLIDGSALVDLVLSHYEDFDVRYKGLIPLKRVYVPEVLSE